MLAGDKTMLFDVRGLGTRLFAILGFAMLTPWSEAHSGTLNNAKVLELVPSSQGFSFVTTGGTRQSTPQCASGNPVGWAVDNSTPQGQAIAASIITAFSTGKNIYISGTGSCPVWNSTSEQVFFVAVKNP